VVLWKDSYVMEKYGADALRLTLALGADDLEDPNFKISDIEAYQNKIEAIPHFIQSLLENAERRKDNHHDKVAISKIYLKLSDIEDALDNLKVALAGRIIFNDLPNIIRDYLRLVDHPSKKVADLFIDIWIRLLSMYIPYISQEIWHEILKRGGYVFHSEWPKIDKDMISKQDILIEKYAESVLDDIKSILKILKGNGKSIKVYISSGWKWRIYELLKESYDKGIKPNMGEIIKHVSNEYPSINKGVVVTAVKNIMKLWFSDYAALREIFNVIHSVEDEKRIMESFVVDYIRKKTGLEVEIYYEEDADEKELLKATRALPLKPAYVII
jgi:leucyl-tRNA synthetase